MWKIKFVDVCICVCAYMLYACILLLFCSIDSSTLTNPFSRKKINLCTRTIESVFLLFKIIYVQYSIASSKSPLSCLYTYVCFHSVYSFYENSLKAKYFRINENKFTVICSFFVVRRTVYKGPIHEIYIM